jgi:hypothetical protein
MNIPTMVLAKGANADEFLASFLEQKRQVQTMSFIV